MLRYAILELLHVMSSSTLTSHVSGVLLNPACAPDAHRSWRHSRLQALLPARQLHALLQEPRLQALLLVLRLHVLLQALRLRALLLVPVLYHVVQPWRQAQQWAGAQQPRMLQGSPVLAARQRASRGLLPLRHALLAAHVSSREALVAYAAAVPHTPHHTWAAAPARSVGSGMAKIACGLTTLPARLECSAVSV